MQARASTSASSRLAWRSPLPACSVARCCGGPSGGRGGASGMVAAAANKAQLGEVAGQGPSRRDVVGMLATSSLLVGASPAAAVQGSTAGRIPGLSTTPDANGYYSYQRPEGKSGGHGVGWSEIPRYSFKVPETWKEIPVSIADLGGTEIDLRYSSKEMGEMAIIVAPVMRFADIGFNANVRIEDLGSPKKIIQGFGPELYGKPVDDEDIFELTTDKQNLTYYYSHTRPHNLTTATAYRNRMFIMSIRANSRQWKKFEPELRAIQKSFSVPEA